MMNTYKELYNQVCDVLSELLDYDGKAVFIHHGEQELWDSGNAFLRALRPFTIDLEDHFTPEQEKIIEYLETR